MKARFCLSPLLALTHETVLMTDTLSFEALPIEGGLNVRWWSALANQ